MPTFVSVSILTGFGLVYGWILHEAARARVYRITGARFLDAYVLAFLIGLAGGYTPIFLYLAFGFKEFSETADGLKFTRWLHYAARGEVIFFVLYAVLILTTVRQKQGPPITLEDLQGVIAWNIFFAFVAILFLALRGLLDRRKS